MLCGGRRQQCCDLGRCRGLPHSQYWGSHHHTVRSYVTHSFYSVIGTQWTHNYSDLPSGSSLWLYSIIMSLFGSVVIDVFGSTFNGSSNPTLLTIGIPKRLYARDLSYHCILWTRNCYADRLTKGNLNIHEVVAVNAWPTPFILPVLLSWLKFSCHLSKVPTFLTLLTSQS